MRSVRSLLIALLAMLVGRGRQNTPITTPPESKMMSFTLDISGDEKIQNPTEAQIRQAVLTLDTETSAAFLILSSTAMTYLQASGDQKTGFDLEYQEADIRHHYRAKRYFAAEEIVKALVSYSTGSDDWKMASEWEAISW